MRVAAATLMMVTAALSAPALAQSSQVTMTLWCSYAFHLASEGFRQSQDINRADDMAGMSVQLLDEAKTLMSAEGMTPNEQVAALDAMARTDPENLPGGDAPSYDATACLDLVLD